MKNRANIQQFFDLEKLIDYLGKMLPDDENLLPIPVDILRPEDIIDLPVAEFLAALLKHINGGKVRLNILGDPVSVVVNEVNEGYDHLFQLTDNTLVVRIHPLFQEEKNAFGSIAVLELSRFILDHNNIKYGVHYADNARMPDIALHIFGYSDLFFNGYDSAKEIWSKVSPRPLFSQLRLEQHRFVSSFVDDIALHTLVKSSTYQISEEKLYDQIFAYYHKDQQLLDKTINGCRNRHLHFSNRDIYEKILYDFKREFKL